MSFPADSQRTSHNQILLALPRQQYPLLFSSLELVQLSRGKVLFDLAEPIKKVYFLTSGMVSLLATTEDGSTTQVAMIGNEGLIGIPAILGISKAPYQVTVQIPGRAMRVRAEIVVEVFRQQGPLQDILLRYLHSLISQISQSAACNRFHTVEERLCRWLLVSHDRAKTNHLPLTQEALSYMLGAPRTNVTKAATALKRAGLIKYQRGDIQILNRPGLEQRGCECYRVISQHLGSFRAA